jgi:propanol-preferring alcohol dehydrogenase
MKAAIVREFKQPLSLEDVEKPAIASDEVLIKVEACGVCHSDLHIAEGDWTQLRKMIKTPVIPGHEVVGRVVEKGESVEGVELGDRVGVAWLHWSCGECELCKEGRKNLCQGRRWEENSPKLHSRNGTSNAVFSLKKKKNRR